MIFLKSWQIDYQPNTIYTRSVVRIKINAKNKSVQ